MESLRAGCFLLAMTLKLTIYTIWVIAELSSMLRL